MKGVKCNFNIKKDNNPEYEKKLSDEQKNKNKNTINKNMAPKPTEKSKGKDISKSKFQFTDMPLNPKINYNIYKEMTIKKNKSSKDISKNKKLLNKKRKPSEEIDKEKEKEEEKKTKSDGDKKYKNVPKFFAKKIDDFKKIFDNWKKIKSIKIDKEGVTTEKLKNEELILNKCKEIAIKKCLELKDNLNLENINHILSYDNVNPNLLYYCFKNMKDKSKLNELISEYKYCFCNNIEIIDYFDNNKIKNINLEKEFNCKFTFKDVNEGIDTLKNTINNLLDLVQKESSYRLNNKNQKEDITFIYNYDEQNILTKNEKTNDLLDLGKKWLENYMIIRDFENFEVNQPFSYENNKILYITFCIFEIYDSLADIDENKKEISIKNQYFPMVIKIAEFLNSLIINLEEKNIDEEFQYMIRFFGILFETKKAKFSNIQTKFLSHIKQNKENYKEKDFENFKTLKEKKDKKNLEERKYTFSDGILKIEEVEGTIEFNLKEYDENLIKDLLEVNQLLNLTWEKNDIKSFQTHNFLTKEDIEFLKETIRNIFKSEFWEEIYNNYCDNDFIESNPFKNDDFINQFFERIIFFPFDIDDMGLFGYTTADNLTVYISGYPYMKGEYELSNYKPNRILQLAASLIVILHESIHYFKRLLSFLTCQMISRKTAIDNKLEEGGNLLEEILFNIKIKKNTPRKINIKTAFDLLNANLYKKKIEDIQIILSKKRIKKDEKKEEYVIEEHDSLKKYKEKLDIIEQKKYDAFLKENKKRFVSASKEHFKEEFVFVYFPQDHRHYKK